MTSMGAQPPNPLELDITILSAKHLKNVNWRSGGDLKPYATIWVEPDRRMSTRPDEFGSTKPVWNENFSLPVPSVDSLLTVEIFHSKPTDTPKPLVGTVRVRLSDLTEADKPDRIHSLDIIRPSGRSQGKIRVKIGLRERPPPPPPPAPVSHPPQPGSYPLDYVFGPPPSGYFYTSPPPPGPPQQPAPRDYRDYSPSPYAPPSPAPAPAVPPYNYGGGGGYSDAYPGYYPNYYTRPHPPPPSRPFTSYAPPPHSGGPSAPVDSGSNYDPRSGVSTVTGSLGIMSLEERGKYEDERRGGGEKVADDSAASSGVVRDNFSDYRGKY